ncbi:MAG: PhoH family protein [Planctomycetes bacterium]|nr:PhoH family protein [Planctomycetota bacterium]NUQ33318.1 PhoH family protein [Planctomycetaceae bacterium]
MEKTINLRSKEEALSLYGERDRYLKMVRNHFDVKIFARNGTIRINGDEASVLDAYSTLLSLQEQVREKGHLRLADVENALLGRTEHPPEEDEAKPERLGGFEPKTEGQKLYVEAIRKHDIVFGVGPAGSGKTFLATAMAVSALVRGDVRRIVLVRPAVEAGEKLGFLPGDFQAKVNPYLRPIFDALGSVMPHNQAKQYIERDVIEIAPLAYMRGRTLDHAFVIFDEAQNSTPKQMLMLLTRLGKKSKIVITGDVTQTDLPYHQQSGLEDAVKRLDNVDGIVICRLSRSDIVRHELVQRVIDAYGGQEV